MTSRHGGSKALPLRRLVPNLITIFAVCAGLTSVRLGLEGRFEHALYLIILAMFLDGADGKVARLLDSASPLGAELDTLSDFFNFGIAPGLLIYQVFYVDTPYANLGWLAVIVLCIACALRLARFNVALTVPDASKDKYFVGVPAPALACLALMPVFLWLSGYENMMSHPILIALHILLAASLAISTIPTFSIKYTRIGAKYQMIFIIASVVLVMCLVVFPWETLALANVIYLCSLPLSYLRYRKHEE